MQIDGSLDQVKDEDRPLVQDVISLLCSLHHPKQLCKAWVCNPFNTYYEIVGNILTEEWEVFSDDLELIRQLDVVRISQVSLRVTGKVAQIRVKVIHRSQRVLVETRDIIRVQRKRRFWDL